MIAPTRYWPFQALIATGFPSIYDDHLPLIDIEDTTAPRQVVVPKIYFRSKTVPNFHLTHHPVEYFEYSNYTPKLILLVLGYKKRSLKLANNPLHNLVDLSGRSRLILQVNHQLGIEENLKYFLGGKIHVDVNKIWQQSSFSRLFITIEKQIQQWKDEIFVKLNLS